MIILALLVSAQCNGAACPNPCTNCTFQPESGTNSAPDAIMQTFTEIAQRQGAGDLPDIDGVESGPSRTREPAEFPCRLLPAIGATESSILQFCTATNLTVISFDCGFGIMQVTSGAASYPGIQSREDINIAAGADILAAKWNGNESFGGSFGESDPSIVESWYFATWAYNGFVYSNNPNNPDKPANRPPFNGPGALSRGSYPYQELVWGYLRNPLVKDGAELWAPLEVSYPTNIPNQSGLFSVNLALPDPAHTDPCVENCPEEGCPPPELRTLILDNDDDTFTVAGPTQSHATGGFRDTFLSAGVAAAGAGDVLARFEGIAPSTGLFDVGGFIPLDPATCDDVRIEVRAVGLTTNLSLDQNVNGGFFATLGQVILGEGEPVIVEVTNESGDADGTHRVGIDAFRFQWRAPAELPPGEGEGEGDVAGEGEGEGAAGEGEGEGEGAAEGEGEGDGAAEGEGEGGLIALPPPSTTGCPGCTSSPGPDALALTGLASLLLRRGRRRQRAQGARSR